MLIKSWLTAATALTLAMLLAVPAHAQAGRHHHQHHQRGHRHRPKRIRHKGAGHGTPPGFKGDIDHKVSAVIGNRHGHTAVTPRTMA